MISTTDFVKNIQEQVLNSYGLEVTSNKHIDCVVCGKHKKMRINWYNGDVRAICVCGSYGLFDLLIEVTGKDFKTIASEIDRDFGNNYRPEKTPKKDTSRRDKAIHLFKTAQRIKDTDAFTYLQSRGIYVTPTGGAKFGSCYDHYEKRSIPAMIALASTEYGEPRQLHVTYIEDGKKADVLTQRKMHSLAPKTLQDRESNEPISIKLFEATDILGVSEGIETALSAKQLYGVPTWSCMNATYLKKFRAPTGVKTLYVFADNDKNGTGHAAAFECARGNILCSNDVEKVVVRWPEEHGKDFNDALVEGIRPFEQIFYK